MRQLFPDWRWREVCKCVEARTVPLDTYLARVYRVCIGETMEEPIAHALDTITTPTERDTLVAYFLGGAKEEEISESLWMDLDKIRHFGLLYVDMNHFRDKLEIFRYADYYYKDVATSDKRAEIRAAVDIGPEALKNVHLLGSETLTVSVDSFQRGALNLMYYQMVKARGQPLTSDSSKVALQYMNAGTKLVRTMNDQTPEEAEGWAKAEFAIKQRQEELAIEDLPLLPGDDVFH